MSSPEIEWTPKARAVLAAAEELFYAQGIHAVGVDAIAERAGVTKKTLYDRFGSKERLVVEYLSARDAAWKELLAPYLDRAGTDPRARLAAVFDASAQWAAQRGGRGCSMINAFAEIHDPEHPAYAVITGQKQWMLDLFREIADDELALAESLLLIHEGALVMAGMGIIEDPFGRARHEALRVFDAADR